MKQIVVSRQHDDYDGSAHVPARGQHPKVDDGKTHSGDDGI